MAEDSAGNRWQLVAFAGIAVALGVWFVVDLRSDAPEADMRTEPGLPRASSAGPSDSSPEAYPSVRPAGPSHRIAEGGRLSIDIAVLRGAEAIELGLGLADEARSEGPMPVRVVSVDGRRVETSAAPIAGSGSGLRLELDPEWLTPGRYMIEVTTAEKSHFPIRRYVLEVQ